MKPNRISQKRNNLAAIPNEMPRNSNIRRGYCIFDNDLILHPIPGDGDGNYCYIVYETKNNAEHALAKLRIEDYQDILDGNSSYHCVEDKQSIQKVVIHILDDQNE